MIADQTRSNGENHSQPPIIKDWISPEVAGRCILFLSQRRVEEMCQEGVFKTARRPGGGRRPHWQISRAEVVAHANRSPYFSDAISEK